MWEKSGETGRNVRRWEACRKKGKERGGIGKKEGAAIGRKEGVSHASRALSTASLLSAIIIASAAAADGSMPDGGAQCHPDGRPGWSGARYV